MKRKLRTKAEAKDRELAVKCYLALFAVEATTMSRGSVGEDEVEEIINRFAKMIINLLEQKDGKSKSNA